MTFARRKLAVLIISVATAFTALSGPAAFGLTSGYVQYTSSVSGYGVTVCGWNYAYESAVGGGINYGGISAGTYGTGGCPGPPYNPYVQAANSYWSRGGLYKMQANGTLVICQSTGWVPNSGSNSGSVSGSTTVCGTGTYYTLADADVWLWDGLHASSSPTSVGGLNY